MGWYRYIDEYDDMQYEFYSNKAKALRENYYEPLVRLKGEDFSIAESELTTSNNEGEYFDAYVDGINKIFTTPTDLEKEYGDKTEIIRLRTVTENMETDELYFVNGGQIYVYDYFSYSLSHKSYKDLAVLLKERLVF